MKAITYKLIGYVPNDTANIFLIPVYKKGNQFYFQQIAVNHVTIDGFSPVEMARHLPVVQVQYPYPVKKEGDFALYIMKFDGRLVVDILPNIRLLAKEIYTLFDPDSNLFFTSEFAALLFEEQYLQAKYFYKAIRSRFDADELLVYMSIVFRRSKEQIILDIEKIEFDQRNVTETVSSVFQKSKAKISIPPESPSASEVEEKIIKKLYMPPSKNKNM